MSVRSSRTAIAVGRGGVTGTVHESDAAYLHDAEVELPDLLTDLQNRTGLTRRSLYRILADSGRLDDFADNPTGFIEIAAEAIDRRKRLALVEGIKYRRLGGEHYFAQELFRTEELIGYLKNTLASRKSVYDHVVYDSENEAAFAGRPYRRRTARVARSLTGRPGRHMLRHGGCTDESTHTGRNRHEIQIRFARRGDRARRHGGVGRLRRCNKDDRLRDAAGRHLDVR